MPQIAKLFMRECRVAKRRGLRELGLTIVFQHLELNKKRGFSTQVMWARILRIYSVTPNHGTTKIKYIPNNLDGKVGSFG